MKPTNILFILSDEHSRRVLGCYGHKTIRTPNLDALAARGVRFLDAYTNSPICVPARASLATGRYPHRIGFWDNAIAYDGSIPSWHHRLREAGHEVVSIGKLHFRSADDDNGFSQEVMPLHINDGIGDPMGWLRDPLPVRKATLRLAKDAGRGDSSYQDYDGKITAAAVDWLKARAGADGKPWCLFVSLVCPHFPLIARPAFYDLYPETEVPLPALRDPAERVPDHPYIAAFRECQIYEKGFVDEANVRRAIAAYFGLVSSTDHNVGRILAALDRAGLSGTTRVLYSADHGDNLGTRGLWGKSTMYEESAGVPMIMAGPGLPQGVACREPVTLADAFPTILGWAGVPPHPDDSDLPGMPLDAVVRDAPRRTVLCEYHATGAATGAFMIRKGRFKFVYYVGMPTQLFDLDADPQEERNLAPEPGYARLAADCERELRAVVDPEAADARAKADQAARIAEFGGRAAIERRGSFAYSPAPGTAAVFN
ncbi:MAG: sulfatase-like hydrolase/transferase [Alphaproteobacteria bacterium]|nr:sulfatase-like hydrolase/transferase [Alphaproteobacteria bacterium]